MSQVIYDTYVFANIAIYGHSDHTRDTDHFVWLAKPS